MKASTKISRSRTRFRLLYRMMASGGTRLAERSSAPPDEADEEQQHERSDHRHDQPGDEAVGVEAHETEQESTKERSENTHDHVAHEAEPAPLGKLSRHPPPRQ